MGTSEKTVVYDRALRIEGYCFRGLARPFPTHFHSHYVLGLVEGGVRELHCGGRSWTLRPGSLMLLNPGESHACAQREGTLDYRSVNIPIEAMLARGLTAADGTLPVFAAPVVEDDSLARQFRAFHRRLMAGDSPAAEEALVLFLMGLPEPAVSAPTAPSCREEAAAARAFLQEHFARRITLDQLCRHTGLSKSTLLRAFTRELGITPYRYLETLRVNAAKVLLEQGVPPLEAALETGFSDQSHFTNCFTRRIGLPPGMYQNIRREMENTHGL